MSEFEKLKKALEIIKGSNLKGYDLEANKAWLEVDLKNLLNRMEEREVYNRNVMEHTDGQAS